MKSICNNCKGLGTIQTFKKNIYSVKSCPVCDGTGYDLKIKHITKKG